MPTRNLGPCACCRTRYATGFRIVEIGGYFAGSNGGIGMFVEHEQDGEIVYRVEFSDGSSEDFSYAVGGAVAYYTEPSATTLSGTFEYDGGRYDWSLNWSWGTYGSATIYKPVAECREWFAGGVRWDGTHMPPDKHWVDGVLVGGFFSDIFWSF